MRLYLFALIFGWGLLGVRSEGYPYVTPTVGRPWPLPQMETPGEGDMTITIGVFQFTATANDCDILQEAFTRYLDIIFPSGSSLNSYSCDTNELNPLATALSTLEVAVMTPCTNTRPTPLMNENYELKICPPEDPTSASLVAQSVWGALRGLETFSQLLLKTGIDGFYSINCTQIMDYPRFTHRGVMLDCSRHYLPVATILENLDLMAQNKFNVFHWHIVDDQSFPFQSTTYPDLSGKGSYTPDRIYSPVDVTQVIEYAKLRGIRVIAEFDTPGHTSSWGLGQPGLLTECYDADVPNGNFGPIDPSIEANYEFLQNLFTEVGAKFPDYYIHLGGDEVPFLCWRSNPGISDFMDQMGITGNYTLLEQYYFNRLLDIIANLPTQNGYIVWEEVFDNGLKIANDTVVHVWKYEDNPGLYYPELQTVVSSGFQAILSSCWYLNYISYGTDWHKYYDCDPQGFNGTDAEKQLVIGGEACMWGEYVDETNLIPRLWPRASAVAERLWSSPELTTSADAAKSRLEEHRCRLRGRGYNAQPLGPSFCDIPL